MALTRPVTKTKISTTSFGQPVYDALIRSGASRSGIQASLPNGALTGLTWSTTIADSGGFVLNTSVIRIPANMAGVYAATVMVIVGGATANSWVTIYLATSRYDILSAGGGRFAATITRPLAVGEDVSFALYNGSGAALPSTESRCDVFRVGL